MKTNLQKYLMISIYCIFIIPFGVEAQQANTDGFPNTTFCDINATIVNNDLAAHVQWSESGYTYFDDGSCDELTLWALPGGETVVKFNPGQSTQVVGAMIYVGDGSFPQGNEFLGTDFLLVAYDNDGVDGLPGTLLDSAFVTVENYFWVRCEGLDAQDEDGIFYLGMRQLGSSTTSAPIGIDNEMPRANQSYARMPNGGQWQLSPYQDFMIRAVTCNTSKHEMPARQRNIPNMVVARISDFDPGLGETPEDGLLTVIDSLLPMQEEYLDSTLASAPTGYYAYGLQKLDEETGTFGDWYYSNAVEHVLSSVSENTDVQQVTIFPNPANDQVTIHSKSNEGSAISITDMSGRIMFTSVIPSSGQISIDVSSWYKGIYFVVVENDHLNGKSMKLVVL